MENDVPPTDDEILVRIDQAAGAIDPTLLIEQLCGDHEPQNVIEALQRALERGKIALSPDGMVCALKTLANAA